MDENMDNEQPGNEEAAGEQKIAALLESHNIAKTLKKERLEEIGSDAEKGFRQDDQSREEWVRMLDKWMALAKQKIEPKSYPWPAASNIKYPLLSTAAMQFAARAYPSLVPANGQVVKASVIGKDKDGQKLEKANRVSKYMSYQLMDEMDGWEEDMDKLLIMLPIVGTVFKKTYFDSVKKVNCSKLIDPKNLVVNYWADSLASAERISEIILMSPRLLRERQMSGLFLDTELNKASSPETQYSKSPNQPALDNTTPYTIIEQHTYLDLDDDDYPEPYIVTFHLESKKVLRITARFDEDTTYFDDSGNLQKIEPIQYYTKFGFVPNPDGGFYDIGFGTLLGPINDAVNTVMNQLVDSGSLNNLQAGFIGKGLRLRMGETRFQPGEWKAVNSTGDDLKKQIVPLQTKEPSNVLFQLMGAMITSGKELASVAEIFVGKMPGQNTPATTTMASIEQGMKVFTAVYKRVFRSLSEEFRKLYRLNSVYLDPNTYTDVLDMDIGPDDFDTENYDICPGADPSAVSQTEKLLKAQGLLELLGAGLPLDPVKVTMRVLEAQEQPNWEQLIPPEILQSGQMPPKQDPKMMELQMKSQFEQQGIQMKQQAQEQQMALEQHSKEVQLSMQAQEHAQKMAFSEQKAHIDGAIALHKEGFRMAMEKQFAQEAAQKSQTEHVQNVVHTEQTHQQNLQHTAQKTKAEVAATRAKAAAQPKKPAKGA